MLTGVLFRVTIFVWFSFVCLYCMYGNPSQKCLLLMLLEKERLLRINVLKISILKSTIEASKAALIGNTRQKEYQLLILELPSYSIFF